MKVIVFGASGFVGGWICELLNNRKDVELLACVRRWAASARLARRGIELHQLDLDDNRDFVELLRGAEIVINAAMLPANRESALVTRLYEFAAKANVARFIQLSSAAVYGNLVGDVDEQAPPMPDNEYAAGKAKMERQLLARAALGGPQMFILRPSIIYGPFSDAWTVRYAKRIASGRWSSLSGLGSGTCNLVHAQDIARAAVLCGTASVPAGSHVLNINGPDVVSWNEYIRRLGDALDIPGRFQPNTLKLLTMIVGSGIIRSGGKWALKHFQTAVRRVTQSGRTGPAVAAGAKSIVDLYPAPGELKLLRRRVRYGWQRAEEVLGFKPEITLTDGLKQSADWCRVHGVL